MPRRAASGHSPSTQRWKFAAAARIASRVISGWPEAPASPLHSCGTDAGDCGDAVPVDVFGVNRDRRSICAEAGPSAPTRRALTQKARRLSSPIGMSRLFSSPKSGGRTAPAVQPLGPDGVSDILTARLPSTRHRRDRMKPIRKAVSPVAGLGTRFLPATKAMPKEMLPVVDRPVIQHVVDEARAAGIEHLIFVTGRNKAVIEDHFDKQFELEATLQKRGKSRELDMLEAELPGAGQTSFTRQQE